MNPVDYYALLGVPRDASRVDLERALERAVRTWSKQTDRTVRDARQEARRRLERLGEARSVLLGPGSRRAYDRALASQPSGPGADATVATVTGNGDWVALARTALATNDYVTAARAAEQARHTAGESAELWSVTARASAGLRRFADAVFEARSAVRRAPDDPEHQYTLAVIFEQLGAWANALQCYQDASRLDPDGVLPVVGIASVFLGMGDPPRALAILENLYTTAGVPDRRIAGDYLAMALGATAVTVPRIQEGDRYVITAPAEIARMRAMLERGLRIAHDPDVRTRLSRLLAHVEGCRRRVLVADRVVRDTAGRAYLVAVGVLLCGVLAAVLAGAPAVPAVAVWVLVTAAGGYGLLRNAWVPRWKVNRWAQQRAARLRQAGYVYPPWTA